MSVAVYEMSTCEPEVAHRVLTDVFTPERPFRFTGEATGFSFHLRSASAGQVAAERLMFSMGGRTTIAPPDYFMTTTTVRGSCYYSSARTDVTLFPCEVFCFPTTEQVTARNEALELMTVRVPLGVVERVAAERFDTGRGTVGEQGVGAGSDLRFDGRTPLDDALRRGWLHVTAFAHSQLASPHAAGASPLVAAALADLVAATALVTFLNTTMNAPAASGPGWVAPAVVRRAVAHVEAHADQPLTVTDIARAARVGPRALQLAFTRHLGTTPTALLRRVRLERAHRELQSADATAGDTVAAVARRWGWTNAGRFSAAYERAYGVPPSRTLRT